MVVEEVCFACCCVFAAGVNLLVGCFASFLFFLCFRVCVCFGLDLYVFLF